MTYSQLQFVKAEAAFRVGNKPLALTAYTQRHLVAHRLRERAQSRERAGDADHRGGEGAFLANPAVVPTDPDALTLTQIMSQKYIAQWGWGHNEAVDGHAPVPLHGHGSGDRPAQVYPGFRSADDLPRDNNGKPVYRIRPRYNSEYVWNRAGARRDRRHSRSTTTRSRSGSPNRNRP